MLTMGLFMQPGTRVAAVCHFHATLRHISVSPARAFGGRARARAQVLPRFDSAATP